MFTNWPQYVPDEVYYHLLSLLYNNHNFYTCKEISGHDPKTHKILAFSRIYNRLYIISLNNPAYYLISTLNCSAILSNIFVFDR